MNEYHLHIFHLRLLNHYYGADFFLFFFLHVLGLCATTWVMTLRKCLYTYIPAWVPPVLFPFLRYLTHTRFAAFGLNPPEF